MITGLKDYLSDITTLYAGRLPQGVASGCFVDELDSSPIQYQKGSTGLIRSVIRIQSLSPTKTTATETADDIRESLIGYRGTWSDCQVRGIAHTNTTQQFTSGEGDDLGVWQVIDDYAVIFDELWSLTTWTMPDLKSLTLDELSTALI